jgi:hypothetical protein
VRSGCPVLFHIQLLEAESLVTWSLEASAVPSSAVPLPAFSPQASELLVAAAEAAPPAWSLQEEECAAAGARSAEAFAAAERVDCGSAPVGWVQDDRFRDAYSVVAQTGGHCAPLAQRYDSSGDEPRQTDCSADSAGYSLALWAGDSSPGGCLAPVDLAWPQAEDLSQGGCSADSCLDDCREARSVDDDLTANDHFLWAAEWDDSPRGDCLAVTTPADSLGWRVADSAVPDWPHLDARLQQADREQGSPDGSTAGWRAWRQVVRI